MNDLLILLGYVYVLSLLVCLAFAVGHHWDRYMHYKPITVQSVLTDGLVSLLPGLNLWIALGAVVTNWPWKLVIQRKKPS